MSSKGSFHSFLINKKARDGAIYDINDGEEDVEESADMQPMHDNLLNDEKKEYKPDDDIFDFEDDGEDYIVNDVTLCPRLS
jgi:type I site-specific restriction-modification system R (restriction) subunit